MPSRSVDQDLYLAEHSASWPDSVRAVWQVSFGCHCAVGSDSSPGYLWYGTTVWQPLCAVLHLSEVKNKPLCGPESIQRLHDDAVIVITPGWRRLSPHCIGVPLGPILVSHLLMLGGVLLLLTAIRS